MGRLDGKVALISGAARGQGEAEARLFAEEGARVVLGDVLDELGEKVAVDIGDAAVYQHLDVTSTSDWQAAVAVATERFGGLDVLVNNAGILRVMPIEHMAADDYMTVIEVNQLGCFLGMQAVIPAMRVRGGGAIVNTSSTSGFIGMYGMTAYTASKFAVRGMTKCAAIELGRDNIRVNSVHPGGIDTEMVRLPEFGDVDSDAAYGKQPIPRIGRPDEVARLMLFLASDESSYCTGSEFVIDGGFITGPPVPGLDKPR
jgi:3alpha(or 20beta)-hydroxysteroid dehydrogenase